MKNRERSRESRLKWGLKWRWEVGLEVVAGVRASLPIFHHLVVSL